MSNFMATLVKIKFQEKNTNSAKIYYIVCQFYQTKTCIQVKNN